MVRERRVPVLCRARRHELGRPGLSYLPIDIDGDGAVDIAVSIRNDDTVAWFENDAAQSFTEYIITMAADGVNSVFAIDVDGNGDVDVLSASHRDDTVAWYENDGAQSFTGHVIASSED
ncbi:hypothetical protein JL722_14993 [Aureococcus anophagefferens]|nr:hypothetical protein JL722_14993 [Aureococcus anophagefferens]